MRLRASRRLLFYPGAPYRSPPLPQALDGAVMSSSGWQRRGYDLSADGRAVSAADILSRVGVTFQRRVN